jgi:hypothetical protein
MLDMVGLVVFVGDHVVKDFPCVLWNLGCCDGLCRCIICGVGLDPNSGYGSVYSWFKEMVIMVSQIAWLHISVGAFDSNGLVVVVMFMMVWQL